MTSFEFIKICTLCGYASAKFAKVYASGKEILTDDDFIIIHQSIHESLSKTRAYNTRHRNYEGAKCTKRLQQSERMGSDHFGAGGGF